MLDRDSEKIGMVDQSALILKEINKDTWKWALGLLYIIAVASIWIAASYVVQTVVDEGVSPFLLSYICNSLFVVYIPIVEIARYLEDFVGNNVLQKNLNEPYMPESDYPDNGRHFVHCDHYIISNSINNQNEANESGAESTIQEIAGILQGQTDDCSPENTLTSSNKHLDSKGRWPRARVAKVSLLICPFWFFAQFTFNLSLKYTTITSNTILSSTSSLFTFFVSVAFLGERFTWVKLVSVLLCMGGTVIVSLADLGVGVNALSNPVFGDALALVSAGLYAVYITLIRKKLPDETKGEGYASMAQFLGYLGLFNFLIFLPIALGLNFTKFESFHKLTGKQFSLIIGKGLLDNVLSDYLWAKAIMFTTTTVATAGLSIQVPIAAIVDSITGRAPRSLDYVGAVFVILGFVGINTS